MATVLKNNNSKSIVGITFNPDFEIAFVVACPDLSQEVILSRNRKANAYFGFNLIYSKVNRIIHALYSRKNPFLPICPLLSNKR